MYADEEPAVEHLILMESLFEDLKLFLNFRGAVGDLIISLVGFVWFEIDDVHFTADCRLLT